MAESVEKLEDVIVRSAEQVSGQIRTAKEAVATVTLPGGYIASGAKTTAAFRNDPRLPTGCVVES